VLPNLCPHLLQQPSFAATGFPQVAQNAAPSANGEVQFVQTELLADKPVPQLTHFFASLSLSAPHFGQAVYGSPQCGQNFMLFENFLAQLEQ
jgi:hypothetical protein